MYFFHMDQKFAYNVEVISSYQSIHPSAVQYTINQSYTSLTMHFSHMDQKFAYNREVRASNQSIHQLLAINQSCTYLTMLFFHMDQKFAYNGEVRAAEQSVNPFNSCVPIINQPFTILTSLHFF